MRPIDANDIMRFPSAYAWMPLPSLYKRKE